MYQYNIILSLSTTKRNQQLDDIAIKEYLDINGHGKSIPYLVKQFRQRGIAIARATKLVKDWMVYKI